MAASAPAGGAQAGIFVLSVLTVDQQFWTFAGQAPIWAALAMPRSGDRGATATTAAATAAAASRRDTVGAGTLGAGLSAPTAAQRPRTLQARRAIVLTIWWSGHVK